MAQASLQPSRQTAATRRRGRWSLTTSSLSPAQHQLAIPTNNTTNHPTTSRTRPPETNSAEPPRCRVCPQPVPHQVFASVANMCDRQRGIRPTHYHLLGAGETVPSRYVMHSYSGGQRGRSNHSRDPPRGIQAPSFGRRRADSFQNMPSRPSQPPTSCRLVSAARTAP